MSKKGGLIKGHLKCRHFLLTFSCNDNEFTGCISLLAVARMHLDRQGALLDDAWVFEQCLA